MASLLGCTSDIAAGCKLHSAHRNSLHRFRVVAPRQLACTSSEHYNSLEHINRCLRAPCRTKAAEGPNVTTSSSESSPDSSDVGIHDVEELCGVRANLDGQDPVVEYRVRWKDGSPDTW